MGNPHLTPVNPIISRTEYVAHWAQHVIQFARLLLAVPNASFGVAHTAYNQLVEDAFKLINLAADAIYGTEETDADRALKLKAGL